MKVSKTISKRRNYTVPWPHYPHENVFSDHRNSLYDKPASFRCDARLCYSPGPAAADALSPKVLHVRVTTHVRLALGRIVVAHEDRRRDKIRDLVYRASWRVVGLTSGRLNVFFVNDLYLV